LDGGETNAKPLTFAPRFQGTVYGNFNQRSQHDSGQKGEFRIGLKKTKIVFGETKKWITFAELSPEKIGVKRKRLSIRTKEVH